MRTLAFIVYLLAIVPIAPGFFIPLSFFVASILVNDYANTQIRR